MGPAQLSLGMVPPTPPPPAKLLCQALLVWCWAHTVLQYKGRPVTPGPVWVSVVERRPMSQEVSIFKVYFY